MMQINELSAETQTQLEAAVLRRLLDHLDSRKDVQNIELMNLAGFCRNCLSKWYLAAAAKQSIELQDDDVRKRIYGMPYAEWKARFQEPVSAEQLARLDKK